MGAFISSSARSGFRRAFDLGAAGRKWPEGLFDSSQDAKKLRGDWIAVGIDVKKAGDRFAKSFLAGGKRS